MECLDRSNPEDLLALEKILSQLPCDDNWDETKPREKALKEAGEKRYYYEADDLEQHTHEKTKKDITTHTLNKERIQAISGLIRFAPHFVIEK